MIRRLLNHLFLQLFLTTATFAQLMPPEIEQRIRQVYIQKYPDDYSMQKILIEDQIQSYRFIQNWESESEVPQDVFDKIKEKYEQKYPDDYSMQKTLIEDQIQSYIQLHE